SQRLGHGDVQTRFFHPHFLAGQVVWGLHRAEGGVHAASTLSQAAQNGDVLRVLERGEQIGSDRAGLVDHLHLVRNILEDLWQVVDGEVLNQICQDRKSVV